MMTEKKSRETKRWLAKANIDLGEVKRSLVNGEELQSFCFRCKHAAIKYIRAYLSLKDTEIPKSNNVGELLRLCGDVDQNLDLSGIDVTPLNTEKFQEGYDWDYWELEESCNDAIKQLEKIKKSLLSQFPREYLE